MQFLIYFAIGFLTDLWVTWQTRCVIERKVFGAVAWTFVLTLVSLAVLDQFIESRDWMLVFGYASGNAAGTWVGMLRKNNPKP